MATGRLPPSLKPLFWDQRFGSLRWERDRDFIVRRILEEGDWESVTWLRSRIGEAGLRDWLATPGRRPGSLSLRQIHFWELVLDQPLGNLMAEARGRVWPR